MSERNSRITGALPVKPRRVCWELVLHKRSTIELISTKKYYSWGKYRLIDRNEQITRSWKHIPTKGQIERGRGLERGRNQCLPCPLQGKKVKAWLFWSAKLHIMARESFTHLYRFRFLNHRKDLWVYFWTMVWRFFQSYKTGRKRQHIRRYNVRHAVVRHVQRGI